MSTSEVDIYIMPYPTSEKNNNMDMQLNDPGITNTRQKVSRNHGIREDQTGPGIMSICQPMDNEEDGDSYLERPSPPMLDNPVSENLEAEQQMETECADTEEIQDETCIKQEVNSGEVDVDDIKNHRTADREDDSACGSLVDSPNNNSQHGHYYSVIWNNYQYMVHHMKSVKTIAWVLFKHDIVDQEKLEKIIIEEHKNGPSNAVFYLLEEMYRDPDPEHHELFYKALEETGQEKLASRLRGEATEETGTVVKEWVQPQASKRPLALPDPDKFTQTDVMNQLTESNSLVHTVVHFASTGIEIGLQSVTLNAFLEDLSHKSVLGLQERYDLQDLANDRKDRTAKVALLRQFILLLQRKSEKQLTYFIDLLQQDEKTADLAIWIKVIKNKCEHVHNKGVFDSSDKSQPVPVEMTIDSQGDGIQDEKVVEDVNNDSNDFCENVLGVGANDTTAQKKCVQISLVVDNQWELENLQKSIEHGLFAQRLRLWLRQRGYDITDKTQFKTTLKFAGKGKEEDEIMAIHMEEVSMEGSSEEDNAKRGQCARSSAVPQSHRIIEVWQKALAVNSFFISEILKDVDTLERDLAEEQNETCKHILKSSKLNDEMKVLILLKLVIYQSLKGYEHFLTFLKKTGQSKILEILHSSSEEESSQVSSERGTLSKDSLRHTTVSRPSEEAGVSRANIDMDLDPTRHRYLFPPKHDVLEVANDAFQGKNSIIVTSSEQETVDIVMHISENHLENPEVRKQSVALIVPHSGQVIKWFAEFNISLPKVRCVGEPPISIPLHLLLKRNDVVVLSADTLLVGLAGGHHTLSCFTLLMFMECNHAMNEHPYNLIMGYYHRAKDKGKPGLPQVVGLMSTARSIWTKMTFIQYVDCLLQLCANLDCRIKVAPRYKWRSNRISYFHERFSHTEIGDGEFGKIKLLDKALQRVIDMDENTLSEKIKKFQQDSGTKQRDDALKYQPDDNLKLEPFYRAVSF